jgi:hypothetical protein
MGARKEYAVSLRTILLGAVVPVRKKLKRMPIKVVSRTVKGIALSR